MVDLELYRIFKVVADEENLTRASEILSISQPAVTKHIHNLEAELQIKLFDRTIYTLRTVSSTSKHLYKLINEMNLTNIEIKNANNEINFNF